MARTGEEGLDLAAHRHPDVVLLDLGLPGIDGVDVVRGIRGWSSVPIIVLSARHQSVSKVEALDAGADDYVTKPFGMDELLARLRAALRRVTAGDEAPRVETDEFTIDLVDKRVTRDGEDVHLTPKEWDIVEVLVRNPGPAGVPTPAPPRRLGTRVRDRVGVPAGADGPGPTQAGGGPLPSSSLPDRARHGVPLRALTAAGP